MITLTKTSKYTRPSLQMISDAEARGDTAMAKHLWALRDRMATRYANSSTPSQRQRRINARRRQSFGR
jgi:hypothetical protein